MELQKIWQKTQGIVATAKEINSEFKALLDLKDWGKEMYKPDLLRVYTIEGMVNEAKDKLIKEVIAKALRKHDVKNLTVPQEVWKKFYEQHGFSEKKIEAYIVKNFVVNADEVAKEQLLREARELVPWTWRQGERQISKAAEIVEGSKLILTVFWAYGSVDSREMDRLKALEKLINIIMYGVSASKAETLGIADLISASRDNQNRTYMCENKLIEKFRIFKNGRFEMKFKKARNAKRIANVLTAK